MQPLKITARRRMPYPLLVLIISSASAQTDGTSRTSNDERDPVMLSPFVVQSDQSDGYRVSQAITGTRIATELASLPITVNIMNREFLDDANVTKVEDALKFVSGISLSQRNEGDSENYAIRGFSTNTLLRNGVRFNSMTDTSNIERIEVGKGPAAILYGVVEPGGIVNYVTKRPFNQRQFSLKQTVGSYDYYRTEFDANLPLDSTGKLLFRLSGSYTDRKSFRKYDEMQQWYVNPVLTWQPTPTTRLIFDYNYKHRTGTFARGGFFFLQKNDYFEAMPAFQIPGLGRDYGTVFPGDDLKLKRSSAEIRLEQTINEHLVFQAIAGENRLDYRGYSMFVNTFREPGFENVRFPQADQIRMFHYPFYENIVQNRQYLEGDLLVKFDVGPTQHNAVLGVQANRIPKTIFFFNKATGADFGNGVLASAPDSERFARTTPLSAYDLWFGSYTPTVINWGKPDFFLTDQIAALDDRLHVLIGLREQNYSSLGGDRKLLPQAGAVYRVAKGISPYIIYSKARRDNGLRPDGSARPLEESKGLDAGVKLDLFDSKLSGTLTYFSIEKSNIAITDIGGFIDQSTGQVISNDTVIIAGKAKSKGFEADLQLRPIRPLQITFAYAHVDAKTTVGPRLLSGRSLPGAVKDSLSAFGKYTVPVNGALRGLQFGGGGAWVFGPIKYFAPGDPFYGLQQQSSYLDVNAFVRLPFKIGRAPCSVTLNVDNLLDERYIDRAIEVTRPRTVSLTAEVRF